MPRKGNEHGRADCSLINLHLHARASDCLLQVSCPCYLWLPWPHANKKLEAVLQLLWDELSQCGPDYNATSAHMDPTTTRGQDGLQ